MTLFEIVMGAFLGLFSAVMSVMWSKIDAAEKNAENNRVFIAHLSRQLDRTNDLAQRVTSLEASVNAEIKNLLVSIKRMESALLRLDQQQRR
jgi:hypothetical protein